MRRIKAACEVLKAPCFRPSAFTARGCKHGPSLWQAHHYKAKDALRGCSKNKRQYTSIWDRWQRDETYRESQLVPEWSDAWVRCLDHIANIDISHTAPHFQRNRCNNLLYLRSGLAMKTSKRHLCNKDQDTKTQRKHWLSCTSKYDKITVFLLSPKLKGNAGKISSIVHCKDNLSG